MSWAVEVRSDGDVVVTIEDRCLSGRDISEADADLIRDCAAQLLAFVGPKRLVGVYQLGDRRVRVTLMPDGTVCRDYRGRVAVRNMETHRLSYVPEYRLKERAL